MIVCFPEFALGIDLTDRKAVAKDHDLRIQFLGQSFALSNVVLGASTSEPRSIR